MFGSRSLQEKPSGCLAPRTTLDPIKVYFKIAYFSGMFLSFHEEITFKNNFALYIANLVGDHSASVGT